MRRPRRTTRKTRSSIGRGKFTDLLKKGNALLKKTKLISTVANQLHNAGVGGNVTKHIGTVSSNLGYGKRRKRTMKGKGSFMDWIKNKALPFLKKTKIISTVGKALAPAIPLAGTIGNVAGNAGFGRNRHTRKKAPKRTMRGRGIGVGMPGRTKFSQGRVAF